jgi:hypothetical protein
MATINDTLKAVGHVTVETRDATTGELKCRREVNNLVVTLGKAFIASRMAGAASAVMSHIAVGTSNVAPVAGDNQLGAELARAALDVAGGSVAGAVVTYQATLGAGVGTGALQEAGLFNAAGLNAGTMIARVVFGVVTKGANDVTTITWTVTIQ